VEKEGEGVEMNNGFNSLSSIELIILLLKLNRICCPMSVFACNLQLALTYSNGPTTFYYFSYVC